MHTVTLMICPWVTVMTHPWGMDNNCVKYYPDKTWQREVMTKDFGYVYTVTLTLGHGQQLCEILSRSDKGARCYDPDRMWSVDRQGDTYILPNFVGGGGINM